MNYFVCDHSDTDVSIQLDKESPFVVAVKPFTGERILNLQVAQKGALSALCTHLDSETEAFSAPYCSTSFNDIPSKTYCLITRDALGYTFYFCLSHRGMAVSLSGTEQGLQLHLQGGHLLLESAPVLLCLRGDHIQHTIGQGMKFVLSLTGGMGKLVSEKLAPPSWLDGLGWESGVSLGAKVSHSQIVEAVKSLAKAGSLPHFVLIDEGWQHEGKLSRSNQSESVLLDFEADPLRFPKGIRGVVDDLAALGVKYVGVWHAVMGCRGGVSSKLAKAYRLSRHRSGGYFLGSDLGRTFQFFYDYYGYLREQGVSFIKVGDQEAMHRYSDDDDTSRLCQQMQAAMQAAASVQFNSAHFNTECLRNENLFYWGNSRIARSAGDIDLKSSQGVQKAIYHNLTNALWLQHLMQPDFDAWLTANCQGEALPVFHALSGSINVIGDPSGTHHQELINKFVLPSGNLIKADCPLTLCEDSIFFNPLEERKIYKAYTHKGEHGIVGAFNLTKGKRTLHGKVSAHDVDGLEGDSFALFSYHNGFVKVVHSNESVAITLKPNQSDVFTFAPLHQGIAVLGCCGFFLAPGPIVEVHIEEEAMYITSLLAARLLVYCEREVLEVRRNNMTIPWDYDSKRHILSIDTRSRRTLGHVVYTITFE